ncbi:MAG: N-acetylmuramoyl-L-alanine amidase [Pseudomonadota bacterium]
MSVRSSARSGLCRAVAAIFVFCVLATGLSGAASAGTGNGAAPQTASSSSLGLGVGSISDLISAITGGRSQPAARPQPKPRTLDGRRQTTSARRSAGRDPRTRFVVSLDKPVEFQVFALTGPNRVIVDMPKVGMRLPRSNGKAVGVITSFRGGRAGAGRSRIIINVSEPVVIDRAVITPSPRGKREELVIDILPVRAKRERDRRRAKLRSGGMGLGVRPSRRDLQPPLPRAARSPKELSAQRFKPLIVIDPGHGGKDSGAKKNGVVEKHVVLKFSRVLRDQLLASGRYRVKMTRSDDRFIPLGARRRFAENNRAALFIAVHADYARSGARGATIYSLRDKMAGRLRRSARKSVRKAVLTEGDASDIRKAQGNVNAIRNILADLAARDVDATHSRAEMFSQAVVKTMSTSTNMRRRPHKEAGFKVLKTAKVPAVLIELAFVTNRRDAALLKSQAWRKKVSASLTKAIDNYFSHTMSRLPL